MRRRPGTLLPLEAVVLQLALDLADNGHDEFYGFALADFMSGEGRRSLIGHGTLYKALDRMEAAGLLSSRWEDADAAASERRPRRRLYQVEPAGVAALARAHATDPILIHLRERYSSS